MVMLHYSVTFFFILFYHFLNSIFALSHIYGWHWLAFQGSRWLVTKNILHWSQLCGVLQRVLGICDPWQKWIYVLEKYCRKIHCEVSGQVRWRTLCGKRQELVWQRGSWSQLDFADHNSSNISLFTSLVQQQKICDFELDGFWLLLIAVSWIVKLISESKDFWSFWGCKKQNKKHVSNLQPGF